MDETLTADATDVVRYGEVAAAVVRAADQDAVLDFRLRSGPDPCDRNLLEALGMQRSSVIVSLRQRYHLDAVERDALQAEVRRAWTELGAQPESTEPVEGNVRTWISIGSEGEVSASITDQPDGSVSVRITGTTGCVRGPEDLDRELFWEQVDPDGIVVQRNSTS